MAPQTSSEKFGRKSERELYLDRMEQMMPWEELMALLEPYDPAAAGDRSRFGLSTLLRTYFLQHWFNLSDSAAEEALYESPALRRFARVELSAAATPDEMAIHDFCRLVEENNLDGEMLDIVTRHLNAQGIRISTSPHADATILDASSWTGSREAERDPWMPQAGKSDRRTLAGGASGWRRGI